MNDDRIEPGPVALPSPALRGPRRLAFNEASDGVRIERPSARRAPRHGSGGEMTAARAGAQKWLDLLADALMQLQRSGRWNISRPTVKEGRHATAVAIRVGGVVEAIVYETIVERRVTLRTMTDSLLCHGILFEA